MESKRRVFTGTTLGGLLALASAMILVLRIAGISMPDVIAGGIPALTVIYFIARLIPRLRESRKDRP